MESDTLTKKVRIFIKECGRVLKVTKKPNKAEFKTIVKVSALGMAIIGLIGFLVLLTKQSIFGGF